MTVRDMLQAALEILPESDRGWLIEMISPADATYREATVEDQADRLSAFFRHSGQWWWRRIPLQPGRLSADLGRRPTG
jgi:hypothetical protein